MQAYPIHELVIPDPKDPDPVKALPGAIDLDKLVKWGPFVLVGRKCTVLKLAEYNVLTPPATPHLTWVFIAEEYESFQANMLRLSRIPGSTPAPTDPTEPPLPPMTTLAAPDDIPAYEYPTKKDGLVLPPCPPSLAGLESLKQMSSQSPAVKKKKGKKK